MPYAVAVPAKFGGGDEMADINVVTSQIALVGVPKARPLLGGFGGMLSRENFAKEHLKIRILVQSIYNFYTNFS